MNLSRAARLIALTLAAGVLTVVGGGAADAGSATFTPPGPRPYLKSVKVSADKKAWTFVIRSKKPAQVRDFEVFIDATMAHGHRGADYLVTWNQGDLDVYALTGKKLLAGYAIRCGATSSKLTGAQAPGRRFRIPQACLTDFTDASTVDKIRIRAVVVGIKPDGSSLGHCSASWSPAPYKDRWHAWVTNAKGRPIYPPNAADEVTPTQKPVSAAGQC